MLACEYCGKFYSAKSLSQHFNMTHYCKVCDKLILNPEEKCQHMGIQRKTCKYCDSVFANQAERDSHVREVHNHNIIAKDHLCIHCGKSFTSVKKLANHEKSVHSEEAKKKQKMKCDQCDHLASGPSAMRRHIESGVFKIAYCNFLFCLLT